MVSRPTYLEDVRNIITIEITDISVWCSGKVLIRVSGHERKRTSVLLIVMYWLCTYYILACTTVGMVSLLLCGVVVNETQVASYFRRIG